MITPQDFDRLSAYIDHQLSSAEQANLEKRLEGEPELKAALADLRLTVRALRSLPTVKPPRNFTLTRAQAGVQARPRFQLFSTLRLATAIAGLAFVILIAGDFLTLARNANGPTAASAPEVALNSTASDMTPTTDIYGAAGGSNLAETATVAPPEVLSAQAITTTPESETASPAGVITDQSVAPTETPSLGARSALVAPTETPLSVAETYPFSSTNKSSYDAVETGNDNRSAWLYRAWVSYLEIGLGTLTVLLALSTWWLWRRR